MNPKSLSKKMSFLILISLIFQPISIQSKQHSTTQEPSSVSLSSTHMSITPDNLMGIHLDELLRIVIENALENHTFHELPPIIMDCYKQLQNGAQSFNIQDLAQILPIAVEQLTSIMKAERALRPDAPGNANGASVGTSLECNFSEVLQPLNRLTHIVVQCCTMIQQDFNATWTILADLKQTITTDINGTFTAIAAIVAGSCDLSGVYTTLNDIDTTLTTCCSNIQNDFEVTWTILADIKQTITTDFNGTFTAIAAISLDTNSTFTALADIKNSLTTCCSKLQNDFNNTWTILANISNSGCSNIPITQADINAAGGSLAINNPGNYFLVEDIIAAGAMGSGIITINSSDVTLDLCNRSLSGTPGNSTSGIFINTSTNVSIKNGIIQDMLVAGVVVNGGTTDLEFDHLTTLSCGIFGFQLGNVPLVNPVSNSSPISNLRVTDSNALFCGLLFGRNVSFQQLYTTHRFTLANSGGLIATNCSNLIIKESLFNLNDAVQVFGLSFIQCSDSKIINCSMNDNSASEFCAGLLLELCNGIYVANCNFNNNLGNGITRFSLGFGAGVSLENSTNCVFFNCQATNNAGDSSAGFATDSGAQNLFRNCIATNNNGADFTGYGFYVTNELDTQLLECEALSNIGLLEGSGFIGLDGTGNSFKNCQSVDNTGTNTGAGFILRAETGSTIENCDSKDNFASNITAGFSYGILLDTDISFGINCTNCYINHNSLSNNIGQFASFGILDTAINASSSYVGSNFAYNNGLNYSVTYPVATLPVVSGSFSGALPATGTTGSFDNISINP